MRKLTIIIVNYNLKESILKCIDSIYQALPNDIFNLIIVDNNSVDGSIEEIRKKFPQVNLIANHVNRGYAAACNQALKVSHSEYLLLLNPDTIVNNSLVKMLQYLEDYKRVGILGCKILYPNGSIQKTAFPPPSFLNNVIFSGLTFRWRWFIRPRNWWVTHQCKLSQVPFKVGWVSGACLMTRRKTVQDIGLLDERFFLGSEDVDWSCRAIKKGWKVVYFPQTQVTHTGGECKKKDLALTTKSYYQNRLHFAQKYYGAIAFKLIKLISLAELLAKKIIIRFRTDIEEKEKINKLEGYHQALKLLLNKFDKR